MTTFLKFLTGLLLLVCSSVAFAGFHLEPYAAFAASGEWDNGLRTDKISMTNFGTKLGYQSSFGLQVGGDIQLGSGTFKTASAGQQDLKAASAAFGAYLGYQTFFGLRGYAHYLFSSAVALDDSINSALVGNGIKLGVGYSIIPWLALNLEYHSMQYGKSKSDLGDATLNPKYKTNFIFVAVSFPFNFGG